MNKNSILGFILIAAIMIGYTVWMQPTAEELVQKQHITDSIQEVRQQQQIEAQLAEEASSQENETSFKQGSDDGNINTDNISKEISGDYSELKKRFDLFANSAVGEEQSTIIVANSFSCIYSPFSTYEDYYIIF